MYNYILVRFNSEYFEYTLPEFIIKKHPEVGEKVLRLQRNEKDTDLVPIQQSISKFLKQCTLERFSQYICYHVSRCSLIPYITCTCTLRTYHIHATWHTGP